MRRNIRHDRHVFGLKVYVQMWAILLNQTIKLRDRLRDSESVTEW